MSSNTSTGGSVSLLSLANLKVGIEFDGVEIFFGTGDLLGFADSVIYGNLEVLADFDLAN